MSENGPQRSRPSVLLTGTPGTGKTTTASLIAERTGMKHVNVGEMIKEHKCHEGRDEDLNTYILDEDKLLDIMEGILDKAAEEDQGIVADFHVCEMFPERWFDLVLCLRTSTDVLFDRLSARGYNEKKRAENMEAEIMQVILEEARDSYAHEIVHEVPSNTIDDMENNVTRVVEWSKQWMKDKGNI